MAVESIEIRRSPIAGRGVFALRDFAPGETVLRWDIGQRVATDALNQLPESERQYLYPYDDGTMIVMQPPARFVNHSCAGNTTVHDFCDIAIRAIAAGEEITSNYFEHSSAIGFVCGCGAPNCVSRLRQSK